MKMQASVNWVRAGVLACVLALGLANPAWAERKPAQSTYPFKKVFIVVLENQGAKKALKQPFMKSLTQRGAYLSKFYAIRHPSQPNYIALVSGSTHGVNSARNYTIEAQHLGDLLEKNQLTWKNYAEGYPYPKASKDPRIHCYLGGYRDQFPGKPKALRHAYARKHVPFLSFANVQKNKERCARSVVPAQELDKDIAAGTLPTFSLYTPDNSNNGHDAGVKFADQWLEKRFGPLLDDPRFMQDMLFVVTYDEDNHENTGKEEQNDFHTGGPKNRIYTVLLGAGIQAGKTIDTPYTLYSLLRTVEDAFGLGTLGLKDKDAKPIEGAWTNH